MAGGFYFTKNGEPEPVWSFDPGEDDPNSGNTVFTTELPLLKPSTTYYVITEWHWLRLASDPWKPGEFETPDAWSFTTIDPVAQAAFGQWQSENFGADVGKDSMRGQQSGSRQ